jgi:hypothetical protein
VLFGVGALLAVLLVPSRRRLEELRNPPLEASTAAAASTAEAATAAAAASAAPAGGPVPTQSLSADEGVPATALDRR